MQNVVHRCAVLLYSACRDILNMYRALTPSILGESIKASTHVRWSYYSDCMFLAHFSSLIGLKFRSK